MYWPFFPQVSGQDVWLMVKIFLFGEPGLVNQVFILHMALMTQDSIKYYCRLKQVIPSGQ